MEGLGVLLGMPLLRKSGLCLVSQHLPVVILDFEEAWVVPVLVAWATHDLHPITNLPHAFLLIENLNETVCLKLSATLRPTELIVPGFEVTTPPWRLNEIKPIPWSCPYKKGMGGGCYDFAKQICCKPFSSQGLGDGSATAEIRRYSCTPLASSVMVAAAGGPMLSSGVPLSDGASGAPLASAGMVAAGGPMPSSGVPL